ncbi:GrpB family protein [Roseisolibacter agri]|uniref:Dephospho-CoA kinase/protein folding accessory domain-containing protein n=1 Tax=Roseisolibacter agri TaxID=2014610 RepID=A0AA37V022_9BACT|nr:GrpB family protein [Roseisolibacter agri]GLC23545.1 hypothetical protein rosag_00580 [Roseisolibacter agri]
MSAADALGLASGTIALRPHDPAWARAFDDEARRIRDALGALPAEVAHVGSTAVPGLAAKPILDLLVGIPRMEDVAAYVAPLEALGYASRGEYGLPGRHYLVRDDAAGRRTHHLNVVPLGGPFWRTHVGFRDALRAQPERRAAYEALKRDLATRHAGDRPAYTEGKAAFIQATLRQADVR